MQDMSIDEWLKGAANTLADNAIPSARLDAEIILAHTINRPRTYLHAHGEERVDARRRNIADARIELRLERVPVAYIIGHKEFYGRKFYVSPDVLIPRPESENIIELLKKYLPANALQLIDVGTGSGVLGVTAKLEIPDLDVTLSDISDKALSIANKNAAYLKADVRIIKSDLLSSYPLEPNIILANLPYVDHAWPENSPEIANEPDLALYADDHGLALIKRLLTSAKNRLRKDGLMILEADDRQHAAIISAATSEDYKLLEIDGLSLALTR